MIKDFLARKQIPTYCCEVRGERDKEKLLALSPLGGAKQRAPGVLSETFLYEPQMDLIFDLIVS